MEDVITSVAALEAQVGETPPPMKNKVIDHIDKGTSDWVAACPIIFMTLGAAHQVAVTIAGGAPGFIKGKGKDLSIPLAMIDEPRLAAVGAAFGSLLLLPSIREAIRINGQVVEITSDTLRVDVREVYGHCGKALIRSEFWDATPVAEVPVTTEEFLAVCRLLALGSVDAEGRADLSPKGDPAGALVRVGDGELWFADRPGNKRVDSFRNILTQPHVATMLVLPGSARIAKFSGRAEMTSNPGERARFVVQDRVPILATRIEGGRLTMQDSAALARANLWPTAPAPEDIDALKIMMGHSQLNQTGAKRLVTQAVSSVAAGAIKKGLEEHYKKTLW